MTGMLDGRRILVVEDDFLAALDMAEMVEERGGTVIGPTGRLDQALRLARSEPIDGAILDVSLDTETSLPVADDLQARGVAVLFATGYDMPMLPARFATTPKLEKPFTDLAFDRALRRAFGTA